MQAEYVKLLGRLGPELAILRDVPLEEIAAVGGARLAEGIGRMRRGEVIAQAGYDGEYGVIRVFGGTTGQASAPQMGLFAETDEKRDAGRRGETRKARMISAHLICPRRPRPSEFIRVPFLRVRRRNRPDPRRRDCVTTHSRITRHASRPASIDQQRAAVLCTDAPLVIVAGPGTGKTRTLTVRIAHLILEEGVAAGGGPRYHLHQQGRGRDEGAAGGDAGTPRSRAA